MNFCCEEDTLGEHNCATFHFPFPDGLNVYNLQDEGTRRWCSAVLECFTHSPFPLVFHCFSGKDRTGVIAAILQKIMNVSDCLILQDYNNSDGDLSPDLFANFLNDLSEFIQSMKTSIIDTITQTCLQVPQTSRVRGGYLPRLLHIQLSMSFSPQPWELEVDDMGRLKSVTATICPTQEDHQINKRRRWQRVSAFGKISDKLCEADEYQWVPVIPQRFGGINSQLNEVLMSNHALRQYRLHFEKCLNLQNPINVNVTFDYGNNNTNMVVGLQKPVVILIKLSEQEAGDDDNIIDIIYN